jgi:4-methyl-5(b-hydroxyethyl)-thiazole monophosphate biosynthesis
MSQKIVAFLAPGFEEIEALAPIDIWRRAGFNVTTVSILDTDHVTGSHQITVLADTTLGNSTFNDADLLFLPGGMPGTNNLNACQALKNIILAHNKAHKPIAAICAAPIIPGELGLLKGLTATCYPGHESRLNGATVTGNAVEVSGLFITGKGAGVALDFSFTVIEYLTDRASASALAQKMMTEY